MDENGGAAEPQVILENPQITPTPVKEMPDEPTAPRRNSTDDNDLTRPRKRPAVMAPAEEPNKHISISSESPIHDPATPSATIPTDFAASPSKTMPLRDGKLDPQQQQTSEIVDGDGSIDRVDDKGTGSDSPLTICSSPELSERWAGSPNAASPAVAEIRIDETDELADHIKAMGQEHEDTVERLRNIFRHALRSGGAKEAADIFEELQKQLKTEPNPSLYLKAVTDIIGEINMDTDDMTEFENHYLQHRGICDNISGPIISILKRTTAFGSDFTKNALDIDGEVAINNLCVELVRFASNCIRCDIENIRSTTDEEVYLYCIRPVACIGRMFMSNEIHNQVSENFWGSLWKIVHALCETGGFFDLIGPLFKAIYEKTPKQPKLVGAITEVFISSNQVLSNLELIEGRAIGKDPATLQLPVLVPQRLATVLSTAEKGLMFVLKKHTQSLDLGVFLNQLEQVNTFQVNLYLHPPPVLHTRLQNLLEPYGVDVPGSGYRDVVEASLKMPIFRQMLSCSRMDFRMRGLTKMMDLLLQFWTEYGRNSTAPLQVIVIKYLAQYLLRHNVVEYLVGPESHFELIRRCYNVPSFLLVSGAISTDILDIMWKPVMSSKDPRVVHATLAMLMEMGINMSVEQLFDLCQRVMEMPVENMDSIFLDFVGKTMDQIRNKFGRTTPYIQNILRTNPVAHHLLIRLIRAAAEKDEGEVSDGPLSPTYLFDVANRHLSQLAELGLCQQERHKIYDTCVNDIRNKNDSVTGSATVILCFLDQNKYRRTRQGSPMAQEDCDYLVNNLSLPSLLVGEIAFFIQSHRDADKESRIRKFQCRLDLLLYLLQYSPSVLTPVQHQQLWTCLVGMEAFGSAERDLGFEFYGKFTEDKEHAAPILDIVFQQLFPTLDARCFSPGVLNFCHHALHHLTQMPDEEADENTIINIGGIDHLWRIILTANDDAIAEKGIAQMLNIYLEDTYVTSDLPERVKNTHLHFIEHCFTELFSCANKLQDIGTTYEDTDRTRTARVFKRYLNLLSLMIENMRKLPTYQGQAPEPELLIVKGNPFTLRYRVNVDPTVYHLEVGTLNIGEEIFSQLNAAVVGLSRVVLNGQSMDFGTTKTLEALGITKETMVQIYGPGATLRNKVAHGHIYPRDVIEEVAIKNMDQLRTLLDFEWELAEKVSGFLRLFNVDDDSMRRVVDPEISWDTVYPLDKPFRTQYSIEALSRAYEINRVSIEPLAIFVRNSGPKLANAIVHYDIEQLFVYPSLVFYARLLHCFSVLLLQVVPLESFDGLTDSPELLVHKLLGLIEGCSAEGRADQKPAEDCVVYAIKILFEASMVDERIWDAFQKAIDVSWVYSLLVSNPRAPVRNAARQAINKICAKAMTISSRDTVRSKVEYAEFFWPILCDLISSENPIHHVTPECSEALFDAARQTFHYLVCEDASNLELDRLFQTWMVRLCTYPFIEGVGQVQDQNMIQGYTYLVHQCVKAMKENGDTIDFTKLENVWRRLLFPTLENGSLETPVPVLNDDTRRDLYQLMLECNDRHEVLMQLVRLNNELFVEQEPLLSDSLAERERWLLSPAGKGGLANLSNTCYLNSLLTQLFMNENFRQFILGLDVEENEDTKLTYSFHTLFARLQNSFMKSVEPRELVASLRDFAGDPIDPTIQMDVDEFFNLLFDRIENELHDEKVKAQFKSIYGGHLVQQVKSKECPHISEREEAFSAIQCDIKGKSTLFESLKAYVEGEIMEGDNKYRCTTCDRLVDAVKRTCLKDVPDNLILHLKRFDFDLQTMNRSKINDFFEFPHTFDIAPYTMGYLSATDSGEPTTIERDEFELVGVLVHTGTAESGHYYSYIKDRFQSTDMPSWFEFNDSEVSQFNPKSIPTNCYGGSDQPSSNGYVMNKMFSAYMLFYQRKSSIRASNDIAMKDPRPPVKDTRLQQTIVEENHKVIRQYCMFGASYITFLRNLFDMAHDMSLKTPESFQPEDVGEIMRLALMAFQQICIKFKECPEWDDFTSSILRAVHSDELCCRFFLQWASQERTIEVMMLSTHPTPVIRQTFARMVVEAFDELQRTNPELYGIEEEDYYRRDQTFFFKFCQAVSDVWHHLQWLMKPWNDFFTLLLELARRGPYEVDYMLKADLPMRIFEMFVAKSLSGQERQKNSVASYPKILTKPRIAAGKPIELLDMFFSRISPFLEMCNDVETRDRYLRDKEMMPMTRNEFQWATFSNYAFFENAIGYPNTTGPMCALLETIIMSTVSPGPGQRHKFLTGLKKTLLQAISVDPASSAGPYLVCLVTFALSTQNFEYTRGIIKKVAEDVNTIGQSGGDEHITFFINLVAGATKGAEWDDKIECELVYLANEWVPALIVYYDEEVRIKTLELLDRLMFNEPVTQEIANAARNLPDAIMHFVKTRLNDPPRAVVDNKTFGECAQVFHRCMRYFNEGEKAAMTKRIDDFRGFVESLVTEEDDDLGAASGGYYRGHHDDLY